LGDPNKQNINQLLHNLGPGQSKFQTKTKRGTVLHSNIPLSSSSKKVKNHEIEGENPNSVKKTSILHNSENSAVNSSSGGAESSSME
jgi:hypothetical protein